MEQRAEADARLQGASVGVSSVQRLLCALNPREILEGGSFAAELRLVSPLDDPASRLWEKRKICAVSLSLSREREREF